ncbi:unnamed protein product [Didymodactylos carnosus]|uniref:Reverse transcriptase RNase H-like domain-containing protein n=1 Tax=Didymodactylos carnosus TaxID=1234261 RepID=A0A8S2YYS0_9BILA|nr:unnamed protein product [Didymodactylos carnosus]
MLTKHQKNYDIVAGEALAILLSFKRMRPYILGRRITIYTDHCPLCAMNTKTLKNSIANRIGILLQQYSNIEKIIHIRGKDNCLADYLSRNPYRENEIDQLDPEYGIGSPFSGSRPQEVLMAENQTSNSFDSQNISGSLPQTGLVTAVQTRAQTRQQQPPPPITIDGQDSSSDIDASDKDQKSPPFTRNFFDIRKLKAEQERDTEILSKR